MANTYTSLIYHIVYSTKGRRRLIRDEVASDLHEYMAGIIVGQDSHPIEIGGVDDHVHILTSIRPTIAVADMVRIIKANSSKWYNEHHARNGKFAWQVGYAAFSVSRSLQERVRHYVQTQRQHHQRISFRDEYIGLLKAHGIEYDERYLFDAEYHG